MNLGGMLDTVLAFILVMLILSLMVQAIMELIKRFFATKAKTMEALLAAMGEGAIRDALIAMKTPPKPTQKQVPKKVRQAKEELETATTAFEAARQKAQDIEASVEKAKSAQQDPEPLEAEATAAEKEAAEKEMEVNAKKAALDQALSPLPSPMARGNTNITPESLKAELLRNAAAVAESIRSSFSRRAELWDMAFQATAQLAAVPASPTGGPTPYEKLVGINCILTAADLQVLDGLATADLTKILVGPGETADLCLPNQLLKRFSLAAEDADLLNTLEYKTTDPARFGKLPEALRHLGALTPNQAQALFLEYVLPVQEEVAQLLSTAGTAAEKFGKLLPQAVRERLYQVGGDVSQVQKAVEDWYDSWMAQFSALYEAKLKIWAFWIGLFVVVCLNANALTIFQTISRSSVLRTSLVQGQQSKNVLMQADKLVNRTGEISHKDWNDFQQTVDDFYQLDIVGWRITDWPVDSDKFGPWVKQQWDWGWTHLGKVMVHLVGWILTAMLIGVGAPFWHNLFDALLAVKTGKEPKPGGDGATA